MVEASVAMSTEKDSTRAGREVAKEALAGLSASPKLAVVAVDSLTRTKFKYDEVLRGIREEIGTEVPLIGSIANGVLVNERFALKSVGLMLLGGDVEVDSHFGYGNSRMGWQDIADDLLRTKQGLAPNPQRVMLSFYDGARFPPEMMEQQKKLNSRVVGLMSGLLTRIFRRKMAEMWEQGMGMPTVQEIITYLYEKGWDFPILGNVSMAMLDYKQFEFYMDQVMVDAVTGAIISGKGGTKFGFGYGAGALPTNIDIEVNRNIGNFFLKINRQAALEGFCSAIGIRKESLEELRHEDYTNYIYLLGTTEEVDGEEYAHLTVTMTDPNLDNLVMSGFPFDKIPEKISIFESNPKVLLETTKKAVAKAKSEISKPKFLLGFDCVLRNFAYGDMEPFVAQAIRETLGEDVPVLIFGSGGEVLGIKRDDYYWNSFTLIPLVGGV
ncbi:MAG: hypothetical protein Kow0069_23500 [Promethearchaeota archaeon]